jgi:hypothetical protein
MKKNNNFKLQKQQNRGKVTILVSFVNKFLYNKKNIKKNSFNLNNSFKSMIIIYHL